MQLALGEGEIQPGGWHHIAVTFSSGNVSAYLDGNVYNDQTCGSTMVEAGDAILLLGASLHNNIYFNGVLDEMRIWDNARGYEDIQADMFDGIDPNAEGLVSYWRFDEDEGETAFDATSGNNDGQLIGTPVRIESTAPFTMPPFITLTASASWPVYLKIGMFPEATDGYDHWIDRYAPPPPPPPTWDAAIYNSIINDRFFIDMRPVPAIGEITEWAVDFQPENETDSITLSWNTDELGEGIFILSDPFDGEYFSINMSEMDNYSFSPSFTRVIIRHSLSSGMMISYIDGWNLVGLPLAVEDASCGVLFPESVEETLYSYNGGYMSQSELTPGEGYWLLFSSSGNTTLTGSPINELTLSLASDWNLISGISEPVSVYSILDPDSIVVPSTLFGFTDAYSESEIIMPGAGYWIKTFQEGEITLISDASSRVTSQNFNLHGKVNNLTINGLKLYFGVKLPDRERLSFSLPPKPPAGAFDVRFKDGWRLVKDYGEIEVMSTRETLTIAYDIKVDAGEHKNWVLTATNGEEYIFENAGEIVIPSVEKFTLELKAVVPATFTLHQNFPNPFNPITTLRYDLPEDNFVMLTVYDMLGRTVVQLANTTQEAGFKSVQWDATDSMGRPVSAGVYIYQIQAGEFVQTKKMVLLK